MEQQQRHSLFLVLIGLMKIKSKIILFTVCSRVALTYNWLLFLVWSADPSLRTLIAFSPSSIFEVYLTAGGDTAPSLPLMIYIRDTRDCLTEWNLTSISVRTDSNAFDDLMKNIGSLTMTNPFVRLLSVGNQNQVGQVISSLSQRINQMNQDSLLRATSSKLNSCWAFLGIFFRRCPCCKYFHFTTGNVYFFSFIFFVESFGTSWIWERIERSSNYSGVP